MKSKDIKSKVRASKEWREFRKRLKEERKVDRVTGKKLLKGWNLHHCDLNVEHYANFDDDNFECLNKTSHEMIHWLYRYKDWRNVLKNISDVLEKMEKLN